MWGKHSLHAIDPCFLCIVEHVWYIVCNHTILIWSVFQNLHIFLPAIFASVWCDFDILLWWSFSGTIPYGYKYQSQVREIPHFLWWRKSPWCPGSLDQWWHFFQWSWPFRSHQGLWVTEPQLAGLLTTKAPSYNIFQPHFQILVFASFRFWFCW